MGSSNNKLAGERGPYSFRSRHISVCMEECDINYSDNSLPTPKGRSGHRITVDDANMYTFGGYNPALDQFEEAIVEGNDAEADNYRLFKEIWKFNFATKEWVLLNIALESFPNELASTIVEMVDSTMIVHGGTGLPFGISSSKSTYAVNLKSGTKLTLLNTTGRLPDPMYGQGSFLDKDSMNLYLVGGTSGRDFFMDVHCLDLKTLTWALLENTPRVNPDGRYRHEIALYDSKLIVFGGGTIDRAFDFQVPAEEGRDAEFIICGGYNGRRGFSDIWSLNLRTKQWYKWSTAFPQPLYFHACALTPEGKLVVFGGIKTSETFGDTEYNDRTNQVLTTWVKIPKLSEIAWEAVVHYAPDVSLFPPAQLLQLGVPRQFVDRISHSYIIS